MSEATGRSTGASEATGRSTGASEATGRSTGASEATGRSTVVAALGGLVIGHMLWLVGIWLATHSQAVSFWVLITAAVSLGVGVVCALLGRVFWRRGATAKAAFLFCFPALPALFSLAVLGVTYL